MSKVLKRLYLGDVVKSFGTKQLRKLTTEQPQEDSIIGTWVFKDTITQLPSDVKYSITFECNGVEYNSLGNYWSGNAQLLTYYGTTTKYAYSHKFDEWQGDYQTIAITGGADINNPEFITWLKANATKQESIVGTWILNQELVDLDILNTVGSSSFSDLNTTNFTFNRNGVEINGIRFFCEHNGSAYQLSYYSFEQGSTSTKMYYTAMTYDGVWRYDDMRTVTFINDTNNDYFRAWLKANATKIA